MSPYIDAIQLISQFSVAGHSGCVLLFIIINKSVMGIFVYQLFSLFEPVI